jgi:acyl carrier protein
MDENAFSALLQDTLQCEKTLTMDMILADDVPEWDSLAMMAVLALADRRFGKRLKLVEIKKAKSVRDLYVLCNAD